MLDFFEDDDDFDDDKFGDELACDVAFSDPSRWLAAGRSSTTVIVVAVVVEALLLLLARESPPSPSSLGEARAGRREARRRFREGEESGIDVKYALALALASGGRLAVAEEAARESIVVVPQRQRNGERRSQLRS